MQPFYFKNKKRWLLPLKKITLIFCMILIMFLVVFKKEVIRVYHTVTLFNSGYIVDNFRNMDKIFEKSTVRRGTSPHHFEYAPVNLPETYEYLGEIKRVDQFLEVTQTTGFIVLKDGKIGFENYCNGNNAASTVISWSVVKSFISALVGIAVTEGYITDIADPVTKYVPSLDGSGYEGVSIKDVLQMSSGIDFNENYGDFFSDINRLGRAMAFNTSLDEYVSSLKRKDTPGTYNHYISVNTQVLGMVLREATGQSLTDYLQQKIWQRIGMESDSYWLVDNRGMEMAFGGFNAILRDYARFGMLYLNNGIWKGEQIISKDWITASITPDSCHLEPGERYCSDSVLGYGYHWWIPENPQGDFLAIGIYGQFIYINPQHKVVIAKSSAYTGYNSDGTEKILESIELFRTIAKSFEE